MQFILKPAPQPAIAENTRVLQRQFGEFDLESVENIRRNVAVLAEKADLFGDLIGFIDHVQALAPSRLLRVNDLAQIKDGALGGVTHPQTAVFDNTPVAVLFAIFLASVVAQEHVVEPQGITQNRQLGRG